MVVTACGEQRNQRHHRLIRRRRLCRHAHQVDNSLWFFCTHHEQLAQAPGPALGASMAVVRMKSESDSMRRT